MTFDPSMNQTIKTNQMLYDLHKWSEFMPDWAFRSLAFIRPKIRKGAPLKKEDEEWLWKIWKTTNYWKNIKKQVPPPDEERKKKTERSFYGS